MPVITRERVQGYAHCAQQLTEGALAFDTDGTPSGEERCPGYAQVKVPAIIETSAFLFGESSGGSSDPMDAAMARLVSHSVERVVWADLDDRPCPYCGSDREITTQVRPQYAPLGGPRGNPDQLFADRKARRLQGAAAAQTASAADRQASALEEANELKRRELDIRERELDLRPPTPRTRQKVQT